MHGTPASSSRTSTISLVVPAMGETIAAGRLASAFISDDFPALGGPAKAMCMPSRTSSPLRPSCKCRCNSDSNVRTRGCRACNAASLTSSSRSSSPKSITASVWAKQLIKTSLHASYCFRRCPSICFKACLRCSDVSASNRSLNPSTSVKSILPLSNARRVNSPGAAGRIARPLRGSSRCSSASKTPLMTARLPCTCNSTTSSPVKLRGPGNHRIRDWSRTSSVTGE
mmetsp:Transcript_34916/g.60154  ORF Transcript_34916/g.60154 Transcript_34916/m.60154 type:complete len:227 (-) Transcript_34916:341-1021(-)